MWRWSPLVVCLLASSAWAEKPEKPEKPKVKLSGFMTVWYKLRVDQNGDGVTDPDAFRLGKVVLRAKGRVDERVGYVVEIDPRSPTLAGVMRDAYVALHLIDHHQIRLGQQKTPFGYENWQSTRELYTITRSELSEGLGRGVTHRDIGIGLVGKIPIDDIWRIEDAIAVVNGNGFGQQFDDTELKNVWARIGARADLSSDVTIHFGLSGAIGDQMSEPDPGPPPIPSERFAFRRAGADVEVDHPWFFANAEYAMGWDTLPADGGETESSMAYFLLVAGKTPWHAGPVLRYDAFDADDFSRITVGGYYGEPAARVRALAHYEYFSDDAGTHDGRITAAVIVAF
jgi:hypothetical protein